MKFPNLKKYFFAHVTVILFYLMLVLFSLAFLEIGQYTTNEYIYDKNSVFVWYPGKFQLYFLVFCGIFGGLSIMLTVIEIFFRKFVIEKYFPNLKFSYSIKLPKWFCQVHSIFFYFGFLSMISIDIYFLTLWLSHIFST